MRRWFRYRLIVPVFRSPHPPAHTARGVANGVFWGLTPTLGLQTLAIVGTWYVARALFRRDSSLLQAFVWVWINNPLTVVPMYYAFYVTGLWLTGDGGPAGYTAFRDLLQAGDAPWLTRATTLMATIGVPLLVGCLPYATLGAVLSYMWAGRVVARRQARRQRGAQPPAAGTSPAEV